MTALRQQMIQDMVVRGFAGIGGCPALAVEFRGPRQGVGKGTRVAYFPAGFNTSYVIGRSIGEDCKTHFPIRSEFFHPGVCPRAGQAASS